METQTRQPSEVGHFFDSVHKAVEVDRTSAALLTDAGVTVPAVVQELLSRMPEKVGKENVHAAILDAVDAGIAKYTELHGFKPSASTIDALLQNVANSVKPLKELGVNARLDAATSAHHDQLSLDPAVVVVSIMQMFEESIPFATYLPTDTKSNEARLAIITHIARSNFGEYLEGASLNGVAGGGQYLESERILVLSTIGGAGPLAGTVTAKSTGAVAGDNPALPLLRGRSWVAINGLPAAREAENISGSGAQAISGSTEIAGTSYAITGTVNNSTGVFSVSSSPALPAGTIVEAYAYVDFEVGPQYAPKIGAQADIYKLYAHASRGIVENTIDAYTQFMGEVSTDARGQGLLAMRRQDAQERHYRVLNKMLRVAARSVATWAYNWTVFGVEKSRAEVWADGLLPIVAGLSQDMANRNTNHGISHLYVTGQLAAQIRGLPSTIFEPSGITDRPGIYRMGRLAGLYEVYYTPRGLTESVGAGTAQILCIGRSADVARNPIVMGDAVPPVFLPLAMNQTLKYEDGFYTRRFSNLNPHLPSAQSAALINVTGLA
mgnify:CR=1 FL=1